MDIIPIIVTLVIIGVLIYCLNTFLPMDGKYKQLINIIAIVATCLWLLNVFGIFNFHYHYRR